MELDGSDGINGKTTLSDVLTPNAEAVSYSYNVTSNGSFILRWCTSQPHLKESRAISRAPEIASPALQLCLRVTLQ